MSARERHDRAVALAEAIESALGPDDDDPTAREWADEIRRIGGAITIWD